MLTHEDIRREAGRIVRCEYGVDEMYILETNDSYVLRVTSPGSAADVLARMDVREIPGPHPLGVGQ